MTYGITQYVHTRSLSEATDHLTRHLGSLQTLNVLEAGCGSVSCLNLDQCYVVGIDISREQLDRNPLLNERVHGDLHTYENAGWTDYFDFVVCWNVIEHLHDPGSVIAKLVRWTRPGGRIVLAFPNPQSLRGVVTKYTPLGFHRFIKGIVRPRHARSYFRKHTFKTYMRRDVRLNRVADRLRAGSCDTDLLLSYETPEGTFLKKYVPLRIVDAVSSWFLGELRGFLSPAAEGLILVSNRHALPVPDSGSP